MNSLEWLNSRRKSAEKGKISLNLPVSPREPIKLFKNKKYYLNKEKNKYSHNKRLHPLREIGEFTGNRKQTINYNNTPGNNIIKSQNVVHAVSPIQGVCPICWHRYIRAIPIQKGKPCFNCGCIELD